MLLNKSLYNMFLDLFLSRVAVTVGNGSGYASLAVSMTGLSQLSPHNPGYLEVVASSCGYIILGYLEIFSTQQALVVK